MDESIRYDIRTGHDEDRRVPCVLAGPTCDSADVMYEKTPYWLPVSLEIGDLVQIEGTGAYTATYSSVAFNGLPPLAHARDLTARRAVRSPGLVPGDPPLPARAREKVSRSTHLVIPRSFAQRGVSKGALPSCVLRDAGCARSSA